MDHDREISGTANLVQNSSGLYSIRFRLGNQRFNHSLETTSENQRARSANSSSTNSLAFGLGTWK